MSLNAHKPIDAFLAKRINPVPLSPRACALRVECLCQCGLRVVLEL